MDDKKTAAVQIIVGEDTTLKAPVFVNQFRVVKEENLIKLFICFNSSGQNFFSGLFIINEQTCLFNKSDTVKYYDRVANTFSTLNPASETAVAVGSPELFYGNFLECCHFGDLAQIRLVYIGMIQLVKAAQAPQPKGPSIPGLVACVLNLPIAAQMGIIKKIYLDA